jgi:hypothetical protein
MPLPISVKLSSIYCHDEGDSIGNAEPYLWTIFFKIDGQNIRQNGVALDGEATFAFGPGSHYNLRTQAVIAGESIPVPDALGEWATTLDPIVVSDFSGNTFRIPGILGIAAVLMEEDNVSDSGAEAGHQALNTFIRNSINNFISGISLLEFRDVDNPKEKLDEKIKEIKDKIITGSAAIVTDAIVNKQPWYSDLWAWVNADDKIGAKVWTFDQDEIVRRRYAIALNERWRNEGDWEIHGRISAPNPCQAQLIAVNRQKQVIKGIEDQIRALQVEFREAPTGHKPALRALIEEVKKELAPAKAALTPLLNALEQCYARQSIQTNVVVTGGVGMK